MVPGADWPLRQSGAPQHHDLFFFFFLITLIRGNFLFVQRLLPLYSSYLMTFFFFFFIFLGAPRKKIPPKFGEPVRPCMVLFHSFWDRLPNKLVLFQKVELFCLYQLECFYAFSKIDQFKYQSPIESINNKIILKMAKN
jgi:hypothetical protein